MKTIKTKPLYYFRLIEFDGRIERIEVFNTKVDALKFLNEEWNRVCPGIKPPKSILKGYFKEGDTIYQVISSHQLADPNEDILLLGDPMMPMIVSRFNDEPFDLPKF